MFGDRFGGDQVGQPELLPLGVQPFNRTFLTDGKHQKQFAGKFASNILRVREFELGQLAPIPDAWSDLMIICTQIPSLAG